MESSYESLSWKDWVWAVSLGGFIAFFLWLLGGSEPPIEIMEDVSVAAGLRPPAAPFPGLWHALSCILFKGIGLRAGMWFLRFLGPLTLGLATAGMFLSLHELMPQTLRLRMKRFGWSRFVVRVVLMQGAVCLACAEPVWRVCRFFGPTTLQLLLTMIATLLCCRAFRLRSIVRVYVAAAILGVLAAETPIGLLVPPALTVFGWWRARGSGPELTPNPLANPLVRALALRRMTYAFLCGFLPAVVANAVFFCKMDGLAAHDWTGVMYVVHVIGRYGQILAQAASFLGWFFIVGIIAVPLVLAAALVTKATNDDLFLPYRYGIFFVLAGLVAFLQNAGWQTFWFWNWTSVPNVKSDYLLCLCSFASVVTFTLSLCVLGVEIFFRNYRRIAETRYEDALEEVGAERVSASFRLVDRVRRGLLQCEPLFLLALILPFRWQPTANEMRAIVGEFTRQTAAECGTATCLFTDGALDAAVEVAAALQGKTLRTLSMMAGGTPREIYLRKRSAADGEDEDVLTGAASDALRNWVVSRPERAGDIAIQLGFELWRSPELKGTAMPACGGFVARPDGGLSPDEAEAGARSAHALAERVLALYGKSKPMEVPDRPLRSSFLFAQWRLAWMCRMRANASDKAGRTDEAMADTELADKLDAKNVEYQRLRRQMDWVSMQTNTRFTWRESLDVVLKKADFRLARIYAQRVLESDPNDSPANFAMGMSYFVEEQYGRAEEYLKRSLARNPDEPAALNNLAVVLLRQERYAEAETNALHALRVLPDSSRYFSEVKNTVDAIRKKAHADASKGAGSGR